MHHVSKCIATCSTCRCRLGCIGIVLTHQAAQGSIPRIESNKQNTITSSLLIMLEHHCCFHTRKKDTFLVSDSTALTMASLIGLTLCVCLYQFEPKATECKACMLHAACIYDVFQCVMIFRTDFWMRMCPVCKETGACVLTPHV